MFSVHVVFELERHVFFFGVSFESIYHCDLNYPLTKAAEIP